MCRLGSLVGDVCGSAVSAPFFEGKLNTFLVEILGRTTHVPTGQCTFGAQEGNLGGILPGDLEGIGVEGGDLVSYVLVVGVVAYLDTGTDTVQFAVASRQAVFKLTGIVVTVEIALQRGTQGSVTTLVKGDDVHQEVRLSVVGEYCIVCVAFNDANGAVDGFLSLGAGQLGIGVTDAHSQTQSKGVRYRCCLQHSQRR